MQPAKRAGRWGGAAACALLLAVAASAGATGNAAPPAPGPGGAPALTNAGVRSISLGLDLSRGNSDTYAFRVGVEAGARTHEQAWRIAGEVVEGRSTLEREDGTSETEPTADHARALVEYRRRIADRWYAVADTSVQRDALAQLDHRWTLSPGVGWLLLDGERASAGVEGGISYIRERVAGFERDFPAWRLAQRFECALATGARVLELVEYLPDVEDPSNFLLNGELRLELPFVDRVSAVLSVRDQYNSRAAADAEQNDLWLGSSLMFMF